MKKNLKLLKLFKVLSKYDDKTSEVFDTFSDELTKLKIYKKEKNNSELIARIESVLKIIQTEVSSNIMRTKETLYSMESGLNDTQIRVDELASQKPVEIPDFITPINEVEKKLTKLIKDEINNIPVQDDTDELEGIILSFEEKIQKLRLELSTRISHIGGGAPHRKLLVNSVEIGTRYADINFITSGLTMVASNDNVSKLTNLTVTSTGGSGGYQSPTGTVNGVNTVYIFSTAPSAIVVDDLVKQKTQPDGTINWTGTTTVTLTIAPNFSCFAIA